MKNLKKHLVGLLVLIFVFGIANFSSASTNAGEITPTLSNPTDWVLYYNDDFNGEQLSGNWVPNYFEHWADSLNSAKANYSMENGVLVLKTNDSMPVWKQSLNPGYRVSGIMGGNRDYLNTYPSKDKEIMRHAPFDSKLATKYGYFEIRAKFTPGSGLAPAFWLIGFQDDYTQMCEIDVFEILGHTPNELVYTLHPKLDTSLQYNTQTIDMGIDLSKEFHTYGFEWDENSLKLYVDGQLKATKNQTIDYRMIPILSLNQHDNNSWVGGVNPSTLPTDRLFEVDYFRIFKKAGQTEEIPQAQTNIALEANASISGLTGSQYEVNPTYNVNDEDTNTSIISKVNPTYPQYIYFDWDELKTFNTMILSATNPSKQAITNFDLQVSADGRSGWTTLKSNIQPQWNQSSFQQYTVKLANAAQTKHLRIKVNSANINENGQFKLADVEIGQDITSTIEPPTLFTIKNKANTSYLYESNGVLKYTTDQAIVASLGKWELETVGDYKRFKNYQTGHYINIEEGVTVVVGDISGTSEAVVEVVKVGAIQDGWWSAQWKLSPVGGTSQYQRIISRRWNEDYYLNINRLDGYVQCNQNPSALGDTAQWLIEQN